MNNPNLMGGPSQRSYGAISESMVPTVGFSNASNPELYTLSESITTKIYTINSSFKQLDGTLKALGTRRDNQGLRDKVHVTQLSTNQIISQTTRDLHRLTDLVRGKDKQLKLQVESLRGRFKEAVNTYSSKQKQVAEKMKFCMLPSEVAAEEDEAQQDRDANTEEGLRQLHQQRLAQQDEEFMHGLQVERLQRVKQIEEDVLDVNEVMKELAAMVVEQEQSVNLIEDNVENVYQRVEGGREELEKAARYQNQRRKRTMFILTFATGIFLVFAVLVYFTLR
ncbi:syntaxin-12 [Macrosteles quadrilineatus]|uniref:syntaxin-12 n=1 Tax=Macrosteles quadrilineatus TaxID=74068 RepID=UPI0023E2FB99|nr:syntaxin-12 [Macrosteles quadrilineatus]